MNRAYSKLNRINSFPLLALAPEPKFIHLGQTFWAKLNRTAKLNRPW